MRGGTSKGLYFAASDLPQNEEIRNAVLLAAMGSPDPRQIDGVGGGHPLTSKIAILSPSKDERVDVDYYFLQAAVDESRVSDSQPCGNILAGVGPWAIEKGWIDVTGDVTPVRIRTTNNGSIAIAYVSTPDGIVDYAGDASIDGVPGAAAAIPIDFQDVAGSNCGALFPTGALIDDVNGVDITCIDNGMPVVLLRAKDFGLTGNETPPELEADDELKSRIEAIRLTVGPRMNLGDVADKTVPKMTLISPPKNGGTVSTRTFIPHRVHEAIGVLGAVSVAAGCAIPNTVAEGVAQAPDADSIFKIEHPTGAFSVDMEIDSNNDAVVIRKSALVRTARKLMQGDVFVPNYLWSGA